MKAQQDIISAVLITIIALSLVSSAYFWGKPMIEKSAHSSLVNRVYKSFDRDEYNSLARKIEYVAKYGGEQTFTVNIEKGAFTGDVAWKWELYPCVDETPNCICTNPTCFSENNSIHFSFITKATNIAVGEGWKPNTCGSPPGLVGTDEPSIVCGKAEMSELGGDFYEITYKTWFRELDDDPTDPNTRGYKYVLIPGAVTTSIGKTVKISRGETITKNVGGKTLFITEIKIFLV